MGDVQQSIESTAVEPRGAYSADAVGRVYRSVSLVGIIMAVGGVLTEIYRTGQMRSTLWPVRDLWTALGAGEPSAWTTLGIWILLAGPVLALISMLFSGLKRRSWLAVALSGTVLAVIIIAIPFNNWVQGGL